MSAKRRRPSAGSSIVPRIQSASMFAARWNGPRWMKPLVTSRQKSPSASWCRDSSQASSSVPPPLPMLPPKIAARPTTTLIPMRMYVSVGSFVTDRIVRTFVLCRAHSGQRIPTGVEVMQSGQIGRSQFEQRTPVSRLGCL